MEGDGTVVRQDELRMWQEPSTPGGAHSRAWSVLTNSRSRFIAQNLGIGDRSEEHTSELQSLMRISYAVFCLKKKIKKTSNAQHITQKQTTSSYRKQCQDT